MRVLGGSRTGQPSVVLLITPCVFPRLQIVTVIALVLGVYVIIVGPSAAAVRSLKKLSSKARRSPPAQATWT